MACIGFTFLLTLASASFFNTATSAKTFAKPSESSSSSPFLRNYRDRYRKGNIASFLFPSKKQLSKIVPFKTWTFDDPCDQMEWSQMPNFTMSVETDSTSSDMAIADSDLVILGVYADGDKLTSMEEEEQTTNEVENDVEDESDENDESAENSDQEDFSLPLLEGKVKKVDESLNGAITSFIEESASTFKNGTIFGAMTPTFRVLQTGNENGSNKVRS